MNHQIDNSSTANDADLSLSPDKADSPTPMKAYADGPHIVVQDEPEELELPMSGSSSSRQGTNSFNAHGDQVAQTEAESASSFSAQRQSQAPGRQQQRQYSYTSISSSQAVSSTPASPLQTRSGSADSSCEGGGKRRLGKHTHRNSSFEYKETLDATTRHLVDGSRIINQYKLGKMIGKGAYGSVYSACLLDNPSVHFAVKEFGKTRLRKTHRAQNLRKPSGGRGRGGPPPPSSWRAPAQTIAEASVQAVTTGLRALNVIGDESSQQQQQPDREDPLSLIRREIAVLKKLHHPHLVHLFEVLDDPTKDELFMVFEFCPDGAIIDVRLHEQVKPIDERIARTYLIQIMLGIEYLHYHDIVHRDIKPDNILLQNERKTCKIVDFGVSEFFHKPGDDTMQKSAGSPAFMSPELCRAGHGDFHGKDSDIWSFGVTFFCMVAGRLPFDKSQFLELYESIVSDEPDYPSHLSDQCKDLLQLMLAKQSSERITLAQMREHPFVTNNGKEHVMSLEENIEEMVDDVTTEELNSAIIKIVSVFTLARAISKFKRAGSRASSAGSLADITSTILTKGKEIAQDTSSSTDLAEDEQNSSGKRGSDDSGGSGEPGLEQIAEAHVVMGSSNREWAAQHIARAVMHAKETFHRSSLTGGSEDSKEEGKDGKERVAEQSNTDDDDNDSDDDDDKLCSPRDSSETKQDRGGADKRRNLRRAPEVYSHDRGGNKVDVTERAESEMEEGENGRTSKEARDNAPRPKLLPDQPTVMSPGVTDIKPPHGSSSSYLGKR